MLSHLYKYSRHYTVINLAAAAFAGAQALAAPVTFGSATDWRAAADNAKTYNFDFNQSEVSSVDDQFLRFAQSVPGTVSDEVGVTVSGVRNGGGLSNCSPSGCVFVDNILSDSVIGMDSVGSDSIDQALLQFTQFGGLRITGAFFTFANIDTGDEPQFRSANNGLIEMQTGGVLSAPTTVTSARIGGNDTRVGVGFLFEDAEDTFASALFGADNAALLLGSRITSLTLITLDDHLAAIEAAEMDVPDIPGKPIPLPGAAWFMLSVIGVWRGWEARRQLIGRALASSRAVRHSL